jgi:hypothetical protein
MPTPSKPEAGVRANSSESASSVTWSKSWRSVSRSESVCWRQEPSAVKSDTGCVSPRQSVAVSGSTVRKLLKTGPKRPVASRGSRNTSQCRFSPYSDSR